MSTIRVSVAYGLTKPGEVQYSSENYRVALELEDEMTKEQADLLVAQLSNDVKLAVITQAGLSAATDENGVVSPAFIERQASVAPVVPITSAPSVAANGQEAPANPTYGAPAAAPAVPVQQGQGGGGGATKITWDGRPAEVWDNRGKKANGEYKPNAADFKIKFLDVGDQAPDNVKFKSIWLVNQNGSVNQAGVALAGMLGG